MTPLEATTAPFETLALGDIVTVPDGRSLSVRVLVSLPRTELGMSAFAVLGELEMLLAAGEKPTDPIQVYTAVDYVPPQAAGARLLAEGAAAYWAPHLPALAGAMGEVFYRVLALRAQLQPMVLLYRGPEMIVFVRTGQVRVSDLKALRMPRSAEPDVVVPRVAASVDPVVAPAPVPAHAVPVGAPYWK